MKLKWLSRKLVRLCALLGLSVFLLQCQGLDGQTTVESDQEFLTGSASNPYSNKDIGTTGATGSAAVSGDVYTVIGSGADIYGTSDALQYVYRAITGDVDLSAQVQSVQNTNGWAKAGLMIRETLNADSKEMMVALTPSNGVTSQKRTSTTGSTSYITSSSASYVRIKRSGSTITTYKSSDGTTWTQLESVTLSMTAAAYVGMAVTSHAKGTLCTAKIKLTNAGPTITTQPVSQSVVAAAGKTVTFTIAATGSAPLTYQWYWLSGGIGGTPYTFGTGTSLNISASPGSVSPLVNYYYCVVTDGNGKTVQSNTVSLTVTTNAPVITTQPVSQSVVAAAGKTVTFTIAATGSAPLTYQWYWLSGGIGGTPYTFGTGTSLSISASPGPVSPLVNYYYCVVTDGNGKTVQSNTVSLTVTTNAPVITTQPVSQSVVAAPGKTVTFTIAATGTGPLSYQWYWLSGGIGGTPYAFGTGTSLNISASPGSVSPLVNYYYCVVTDGSGATTQSNTVSLTVTTPGPTITTQPASQSVVAAAGKTVTFTIAATGTGTLSYQWYWLSGGIGGTPYAFGTGTSLNISASPGPVSPLVNYYYCVVTDGYGRTAQSNTVSLTVATNAPAITTQPVSQSVIAAPGKTVTFTIAATGTGALSYQWYWLSGGIGGTPYTFGTGTSLGISASPGSVSPLTNYYYCIVTDGNGATTQSNTVSLTVTTPGPTITSQPTSASVCAASGQSTSFAIAATGNGPLSYQWYWLSGGIGGTPYTFGTGTTLSISTSPGTVSPLVNYYYCAVTDTYGRTVQSNTISLTTTNPPPSPVITLWGETTDHVWAQLDSQDPNLGIIYRNSTNGGASFAGWIATNYTHFWPNVGPLGLSSGSIVVQAYVQNAAGCTSPVTQGSYIH